MNNDVINILIGDVTSETGTRLAYQLSEYGMYAFTKKNEEEALLNAIRTEHPDVVIIDLTLKNTDAIKVINKTRSITDVNPIFIVYSTIENEYIKNQVIESGASYFVSLPLDAAQIASIIKSSVNKSITENCENLEVIVTNTMNKLLIPANMKGYYYLRTGIMSVLNDRSLIHSVTKELYPHIAKIHNTSAVRVERSIRSAIDSAWNRGLAEKEIPGLNISSNVFVTKPKNSEFIALVSDKIRLNIKYDPRNKK